MRRALRISVGMNKSERILSQEEGPSWTRWGMEKVFISGFYNIQAPEINFKFKMAQPVISQNQNHQFLRGGWVGGVDDHHPASAFLP